MATKKLLPSQGEQSAKSQAVIDYEQQRAIEERYKIEAEKRAAERERVERIQKENRSLRDDYEDDLRRTSPKFKKDVKVPTYRDPGNGDTFGYGPERKPDEPWKPTDTKAKDGKSPKIGYTDIGGKRFTAAFETPEFRDKWIADKMKERGFEMAERGKAMPVGYTQALGEVSRAWSKQASEWSKQKRSAVEGMWRDQQKPAGAVQPGTAPDIAAQAQAAETQGQKAAEAAAASPVKKDPAVVEGPPKPQEAPASVTTTVQTDQAAEVAKPTPGPKSLTFDGRNNTVTDGNGVTRPWKGGGDEFTNKRVAGTETGRFVDSRTMFFGSDSAFADYKKKEGILI